jgi:hypothetical protein
MPRWPSRHKYAPLAAYLAAQPGDRVMLTFAELEAILGAALPPSARTPPWWANTRLASAQGRAWLGAGWRVARVDLRDEPPAVTFARGRPDSTA